MCVVQEAVGFRYGSELDSYGMEACRITLMHIHFKHSDISNENLLLKSILEVFLYLVVQPTKKNLHN